MTLPNFLIVGAAKSGTTSFNYYLKEHPQIFMSKIKEPYFFSSQGLKLPECGPGDTRRKYILEFEKYQSLFDDVKNESAIGEASSDTMYNYSFSVDEIKRYLGDPKILIFLRNPADRAFSAYTHLLREGFEQNSFEVGLQLEQDRIKNNWNSIWHYRQVGLYANQVDAFLKSFTQVKVMLYEEMMSDVNASLIELFKFLGVDPSFRAQNTTTRYNVSGLPKSQTINNFLNMKNPVQKMMRRLGSWILSEDRYIQLREQIRMSNLKKPMISKRTRLELLNFYKNDILELQEIINKDLSIWYDN